MAKANVYCYAGLGKKNHPGPPSILKANQDELLKFVVEMRDTGMPIKAKIVQLEAAMINCSFCNKSNHVKKSIVESFLKSNAITYCKGTLRLSLKQKISHLTSSILFIPLSIIQIICQDLYATVTNLEFFNPNIKRTLEKQGTRIVSIHLSNVDTK